MATKATKITKKTKVTTARVASKAKSNAAVAKTRATATAKPAKIAPVSKQEKTAGGTVAASVVGVDGKVKGKITLPVQWFGVKVNKPLLSQAVRVYLANQREGGASTKTRGEVEGSTRKIYRQKGTGRARHGGIRAPIFVGGGIVFGPRPKDFRLLLPKKMKVQALASALTSQYNDGNVVIVDGLESLKPKTKIMAKTLVQIGRSPKTLLVVSKGADMVVRSARNIEGVDVMPAESITTYDVLGHSKVIFTKDAVGSLKERGNLS